MKHCTAVVATAGLMLLAACGESAPTSGASAAATVSELPLRRGFYVSSDTACGDASNATLLLMKRDGINGSRDACAFQSIEQTGPQSYRVIEQCADLQAGADEADVQGVVWEIPDDSRFTSKSDSGWERSFRYCEQASLPDSWRDNDISDLVE